MLKNKAHKFLISKGIKSLKETVPAIMVEKWLIEFVKQQNDQEKIVLPEVGPNKIRKLNEGI